jgi:hypothetical protein
VGDESRSVRESARSSIGAREDVDGCTADGVGAVATDEEEEADEDGREEDDVDVTGRVERRLERLEEDADRDAPDIEDVEGGLIAVGRPPERPGPIAAAARVSTECAA